jgi:hypothetical protein
LGAADVENLDEKRNSSRLKPNCDIQYRRAAAGEFQSGTCITLSGGGLGFLSSESFDEGLALEIRILPSSSIAPPMTAFVEVIRSVKQADDSYKIAAVIKSIKGN